MEPWRVKRAMASYWTLAESQSKFRNVLIRVYSNNCDNSEKIPTWAKDEEGQKYQKVAWEAVAMELEVIEPDCLKQILEL
jgi:hypothetical protein